VADTEVRLGAGTQGPTGRLVRVEVDGHVFLLFTNLREAPAELIALIYRYRWRIELFLSGSSASWAVGIGWRPLARA